MTSRAETRLPGNTGLILGLVWALAGLGCTGGGTSSIRDIGAAPAATGSIAATGSAAAAAPATPQPVRAVAIAVVPETAEINIPAPAGASGPRVPSAIRLQGTVYHSDGSIGDEIAWTSSDPGTALVDPTGLVSAVLPGAVGTVVVTARSRLDASIAATAAITVRDFGPQPPDPQPPRRPNSVLIFPLAVEINTPAEATAPAIVRYPASAHLIGTVFWTDGTISDDVVWESLEPRLVAVDASGSVRSLIPGATGSAIVRAAARANPALVATASVLVSDLGPFPAPVPSPVPGRVLVFPSSVIVNSPPEEGQGSAGRYPHEAAFEGYVFMSDGTLTGEVLWESDNPDLVRISAGGLAAAITPHAEGSALITAYALRDPAVAGTASVIVQDRGPNPTPIPPVVVSAVSVFPAAATINTPYDPAGDQPEAGFPTSIQLVGEVVMTDGSVTDDLLWSSGNVTIATVDQTGFVQSTMIRSTGTVRVTAQARRDPAASASAFVTVVDSGKVEIDVQ